jgi:hypothetical protein
VSGRRSYTGRAPAPLLWGSILGLLFASMTLNPVAHASSRIKDIADFEGVRDNILVGYGLVVGLNGTGGSLTNAVFTKESLTGMLERLGINTRDGTLKSDNVAAVIVTASPVRGRVSTSRSQPSATPAVSSAAPCSSRRWSVPTARSTPSPTYREMTLLNEIWDSDKAPWHIWRECRLSA